MASSLARNLICIVTYACFHILIAIYSEPDFIFTKKKTDFNLLHSAHSQSLYAESYCELVNKQERTAPRYFAEAIGSDFIMSRGYSPFLHDKFEPFPGKVSEAIGQMGAE